MTTRPGDVGVPRWSWLDGDGDRVSIWLAWERGMGLEVGVGVG